MRTLSITLMAAALAVPTVSHAAVLAADSAADTAYGSGWKYGTNGGYGFQPWAGGTSGDTIGGTGASVSTEYPSGTPIATSGKSWTYNPGGTSTVTFATRAFTGNSGSGIGSLDVGQSFSFDFDNGWGSSGEVGLNYLGSDGSVRMTLTARNAWQNSRFYSVDLTGSHQLVPATAREGARAVFTLDTANTYSLSITTNLAGTPVTQSFSGTLTGTADSGVAGVSLFKSGNLEGWSLPNYQRDFNSFTIVPEPAALGLLGLGGLVLAGRSRRRPTR